MGLFDGVRGDALDGTTAEAAALLKAPVLLVVDASASAGSVGALLLGFKTYEPSVDVAGVVFNKVAGARHVAHLDPAARRAGVRVLGALERDGAVAIPERKLGLAVFGGAGEDDRVTPILDRLADAAERSIDLDGVVALARSAPTPSGSAAASPSASPGASRRTGPCAGPSPRSPGPAAPSTPSAAASCTSANGSRPTASPSPRDAMSDWWNDERIEV